MGIKQEVGGSSWIKVWKYKGSGIQTLASWKLWYDSHYITIRLCSFAVSVCSVANLRKGNTANGTKKTVENSKIQ